MYFTAVLCFSAELWCCWLGGRRGVRPVEAEWWGAGNPPGMVVCLQRVAQLVPLPLAVSCSCRVQIRFAFLVPAHVGSPGQGGVKRVCVCVYIYIFYCCE